MLHNDLVNIENEIAIELLNEVLASSEAKQALQDVAKTLLDHVVAPVQKICANTSVPPEEVQAFLICLARELSGQERQYGALFPEVPFAKDLINTPENIQLFLDALIDQLSNIEHIKTFDQVSVLLKVMLELGCAYFGAPDTYHQPNFTQIKNFIFPSQEEEDIRIAREYLGQPKKFAYTFGIGTEEEDLRNASEGVGRIAGKSIFGAVNMHIYLQLMCDLYDKTKLQKYADKLKYYDVPLDVNKRESIASYANKKQTCFEKLVQTERGDLPLVASVSRSAARILITLQDLGAFNKADGTVDFEKAKIIHNCFLGFIVHGGHHSISEVCEAWNRWLDYIAITNLDAKGPNPDLVEEKMPYFRFNYGFFSKGLDKLEEPPVERPLVTKTM